MYFRLSLEKISDLLFTPFPTATTTATSASTFTCHFSGTPAFAFSALKYDILKVKISIIDPKLCALKHNILKVWFLSCPKVFFSKQIFPRYNQKCVKNFLDLSLKKKKKGESLEIVNAPFQDSQDWLLSAASFGFYFFLLCLRVCIFIALTKRQPLNSLRFSVMWS